MTRPLLITPSILSADLGRLQEEIQTIEPYADWIQVDVMDGHFVPNLTFGAPVLKCVRTKLPLDIHLMVANPGDRLDEFLAVGAKNITFHSEAAPDTAARQNLCARIRAGGATVGIALNPDTPISVIEDIVDTMDLVLVMSVQPGFSGQAFRPEVLEKVRSLRARFPRLMIQMDGGIDAVSAQACREAGADNLVSASFIFDAADRAAAIAQLRA